MPVGCAVILAGLCLQAPYDRAVDLEAFYRMTDAKTGARLGVAQPAAVKALGVRIEVYSGDDLQPHETAGLSRACAGESCLLYAKTCAADGLVCEWDWGPNPSPGEGLRSFTVLVTAKTPAAMAKAISAASIRPADQGYVPLAAMKAPSPYAFRPPCEGEVSSDCTNLFYGLIPVLGRRGRGATPMWEAPNSAAPGR